MSLRAGVSGNPHKSKMEDGSGEEPNPFSFKSFVSGKTVDPPPYPSNTDKKDKQKNRQKTSSRVKKKESFHEDEVPFPDVEVNLVEEHSDHSNSAKTSQENIPCEDEASNGEKEVLF